MKLLPFPIVHWLKGNLICKQKAISCARVPAFGTESERGRSASDPALVGFASSPGRLQSSVDFQLPIGHHAGDA